MKIFYLEYIDRALLDAASRGESTIFTFKITAFLHTHTHTHKNKLFNNVSFCINFPGDFDETKRLIETEGANVNARNYNDETPMILAVNYATRNVFEYEKRFSSIISLIYFVDRF